MEENQQDKAENKHLPTEDIPTPTSLSPQDQSGTDQLQKKNQMDDEAIKQLRNGGYKVTEEYDAPGHISKITAERKTRWDWVQLVLQLLAAIVIPLSIVIGAWQFTTQLAANQAQALDQQHQTTLDTYLDRMSDLLLTYPDHFKVQQDKDPYQVIAQARTYTAVRNLDGSRKGTLVRFLVAAGLLSGSQPIISMTNADLSGAIFANADLSGANLSGADLIGAIFANADLSGTDLSEADLIGTVFTNADLSAPSANNTPSIITCQCSVSPSNGAIDLSNTVLDGARYNTEPAQEGTLSFPPTQWPQGFDPQAYGAQCVDC